MRRLTLEYGVRREAPYVLVGGRDARRRLWRPGLLSWCVTFGEGRRLADQLTVRERQGIISTFARRLARSVAGDLACAPDRHLRRPGDPTFR